MRINQNSKTARALAVLQKAEVPLSERDVAAAIHDLRFSRYDAEYHGTLRRLVANGLATRTDGHVAKWSVTDAGREHPAPVRQREEAIR